MIQQSPDAALLQRLFAMARDAGFELVDMSRFAPDVGEGSNDDASLGEEVDGVGHFLLTFRTVPPAMQASEPIADAQAILDLAQHDQPMLYQGLAQLILDHATAEDIEALLPGVHVGSLSDRVAEHVATVDSPDQLLIKVFGIVGLRRIAAGRGWLTPEDTGASDTIPALILKHLGFTVPNPPQGGATALIRRLRECGSRVQLAHNLSELEGAAVTSFTDVDGLLKRSVFAWARALFGDAFQERLRDIIRRHGIGGSLDRLTMGQVVPLFCTFPDAVAQSYADRALAVTGREYIYRAEEYRERLNRLKEARNHLAHPDEPSELRDLAAHRAEYADALRLAAETVEALVHDRCIPMLGRPVRATLDAYNRRMLTLHMEDDTMREIFTSAQLVLGDTYVYLTDRSNPRAVDPVLVPVADL